MSIVPRIPCREPTDPAHAQATGGIVRIGQLAVNHPAAHGQGMSDLHHSQTLGTDDVGLTLARLSYALRPALLSQGIRRFHSYDTLQSP